MTIPNIPPSEQRQDASGSADGNSSPVYDTEPDEDDDLGIKEVTEILKCHGLGSARLIVGLDFTKTNKLAGASSFDGKSLHCVGAEQNPYEQTVSIIGKALDPFDKNRMIPCFGFGDESTKDQQVFRLHPCESLFFPKVEEVINRYRDVVPELRLGEPKSFAPIIEMAMSTVAESGGEYHVLVIITDGQVTRGVDTEVGQLSPQEKKTVEAIVKASKYPLSIVVVGVGDGPWDTMKELMKELKEFTNPQWVFDNFQFVIATDFLSKNMGSSRKEREFAYEALKELPLQYLQIQKLGLLGATRENAVDRMALSPPRCGSYLVGSNSAHHAPDNHDCPICLTNPKDMAFGCGHRTCCDCGRDLQLCPICRDTIKTKIKLYN